MACVYETLIVLQIFKTTFFVFDCLRLLSDWIIHNLKIKRKIIENIYLCFMTVKRFFYIFLVVLVEIGCYWKQLGRFT